MAQLNSPPRLIFFDLKFARSTVYKMINGQNQKWPLQFCEMKINWIYKHDSMSIQFGQKIDEQTGGEEEGNKGVVK